MPPKSRTLAPARRTLVIEVDVSDWTDEQIQSLDMRVSAQFEAAEDGSHPDAEESTSRIVDEYRDPLGFDRPRVKTTWLSGAPAEAVTRDPSGAL